MTYWLVKTEPSTYSFADLLREKRTAWTGVKNAAAQLNLRRMKKGDRVLIYHTGGEKAVVGTARIAAEAYVDPTGNGKLVAVDLEADAALGKPVTLLEIKADKRFAGWDLLRIGRLSIVPTTKTQFEVVMELGGGGRR